MLIRDEVLGLIDKLKINQSLRPDSVHLSFKCEIVDLLLERCNFFLRSVSAPEDKKLVKVAPFLKKDSWESQEIIDKG